MKIAILGGGLTGLTAAYYLKKKGNEVTVFEKEGFLGGLTSGFKRGEWRWSLDKTYHHVFSCDKDILDFAKEIGFDDFGFYFPQTASMYKNPKSETQNQNQVQNPKFNLNSEFLFVPLDTPSDLLKFPYLNLYQKLRAGMVMASLKLSPPLSSYEKQTSEEFLQKTMGNEAWNILWQELFRKKFGKYAEKILASFIWARIKKRTKKLGYPKGGFQALVDYLEKINRSYGIRIHKSCRVVGVQKKDGRLAVETNLAAALSDQCFDKVISTLPTQITIEVTKNLFPADYINKLSSLKYLSAVNLIIESDFPLLEKTYWLNVAVSEIPIMGLIQHTNFIDKSNYGSKHILYVANYVDDDNSLLKMTDKEIFHYFQPYLNKIKPHFDTSCSLVHVTKFPFAQPIFDNNFIKNKPTFVTPIKNFYMANLDMTYPYDRGTNYAVSIAKKISEML